MPKKVIDYLKCIIYKIVCNDLAIKDCYVGHTTNFTQRKKEHKTRCVNLDHPKNHYKIYIIINANGGWNNWNMIEVEKYPCKDINEASARERYWYEILNANLNMSVPNRTIQEWYENNKSKLAEKAKEKYVCDCGSICGIYMKQKHFRTEKHQDFILSNNINAEKITETEEIISL